MPERFVSIIVPCFNEAEVLPEFLDAIRKLAAELPRYVFEFLFVDDGSRDDTAALLHREADRDDRVHILQLSRNFGQQRAITAGTDFCRGDFVVILDADLQDPPGLIPQMLQRLEEGFDLVHAVRDDRGVDSLPKRFAARVFYAFMRRWVMPELPVNAGEFKAFNRNVLIALRTHRERVRFLRGAFATMGFAQTQVYYARAPRRGGHSKFPLKAVVRLARDAVLSNSSLPLRAGLYLGLLVCLGSLAGMLTLGVLEFSGSGVASPLLAFLLLLLLGVGGAGLIMLGFVGEYLKILLLEVKHRPLYVIRSTRNVTLSSPLSVGDEEAQNPVRTNSSTP